MLACSLAWLVGWLVGWLFNESILSRGSNLNTAPAKLCALVELGRYMVNPGCSCSHNAYVYIYMIYNIQYIYVYIIYIYIKENTFVHIHTFDIMILHNITI